MATSSEPWTIEGLSPEHRRDGFSCGEPSLDEFLNKYAGQYEKKDIGRTYVAHRPGDLQVFGYYTISSGSVAFASLPPTLSKKLPKHPVPVAHLGRLAVDQRVRGQRLGETLLLDALARCHQLSQELGMAAVEVYALNDSAKAFYLKFGFEPLLDHAFHLYLPMKAVRKLGGK